MSDESNNTKKFIYEKNYNEVFNGNNGSRICGSMYQH